MDLDRRRFLTAAGAALAAGAVPRGALAQTAQTVQMPFANGERPLAAFPQKRPLILVTPRPPQLETPFAVFDQGVFTPNDAFFVRWHLANIPQTVDASAHRIAVSGEVNRTLSLSMDDLAAMPQVEVAAVNQCSGNSRGLFAPRVAGGEWGNGAMGNALWTGVRLRDILDRAGLKSTAKQVQFDGLDGPPLPTTPDFKKSLDVGVARGDDVIVAYAMNGEPLPLLNGYPVRLIVPGWFATYWVKMLSAITVLDHVDDNFWMKTAYRIPDTPDNSVAPGSSGYPTIPINRMRVRSFVTNLADGARIAAGRHDLRGIAFDGGSGVRRVEISTDGGKTWTDAALESDYGKYSFRRWNAALTAPAGGTYTIAVRATANDGSLQPMTAGWNPSGYLRNSVETYTVTAS
ncbi:MAG TPA: molybdopterin-dependent oxidoreductase [Candidatus Elarobacter sp.]|jgi:DMSO/TMAO reductase YedYZ molybdopterin-dependent catalytic subunit|nr:molybdopterin-dependent oxidoreductase [Candidatus Elarobacter sp.]